MNVEYNRSDIRRVERQMIKRVKEIVFSTRRDTPKRNGKYVIERRTGDLDASIRRNTNFIETDKKGNITINLKVMNYFIYLDEGTSKMDGWYLTEAIFDDREIRKLFKDLQEKTFRKAILEITSDIFVLDSPV